MNISKIKEKVEHTLSRKRFAHTLAVEKEALKLGSLFGAADSEQIRIAALLHDFTKELDTESQYRLCERYGIPVTGDDRKVPKSLHAKTAAYTARHEFECGDTVFNAIYRHTFGAPDMSVYDKIIYLADYIGEDRTFEDCVLVRKYFYKTRSLDAAILYSLNITLTNLIKTNEFIHPDTLCSRNAFLIRADIKKHKFR